MMMVFNSQAEAKLLKEKTLIGRVEWVEMPNVKLKFKARVDTGAKTTSLHATQIQEVQKNGELFIKFITQDDHGQKVELLKKVITTQRVSNTSGDVSKRYVIKDKILLGPMSKEVNINLNDRSKMQYKFLIGRNILLGQFVVDVAKSHTLGH